MNYQISGLDPNVFDHILGKESKELSAVGIQRMTVDQHPGFPCRISLEDAKIGETVLLLNYLHQPAESPYQSSHAIFVRESAPQAALDINEIPLSLKIRLLSVRSFDEDGMMLDAAVVEGEALDEAIQELFTNASCSYLHIHNAARGCFAARVDPA